MQQGLHRCRCWCRCFWKILVFVQNFRYFIDSITFILIFRIHFIKIWILQHAPILNINSQNPRFLLNFGRLDLLYLWLVRVVILTHHGSLIQSFDEVCLFGLRFFNHHFSLGILGTFDHLRRQLKLLVRLLLLNWKWCLLERLVQVDLLTCQIVWQEFTHVLFRVLFCVSR